MNDTAASRCPQAELAVGWALYALEQAEEVVMRVHLPQCPECSEIVRETEDSAALLALTADQYDPPPRAWQRLMTAIDHGRREGRPPVDIPAARLPRTSRRRPEPHGSGAAGNSDTDTSRWRRRAKILAGAATVLLVIAGGFAARTVQLEHQRDGQADQPASSLSPAQRRQTQYTLLTGTASDPAAVVLHDGGQRAVIPIGLAPNAPGTTYVLWGTTAGTAVPIGVFDITPANAGEIPLPTAPNADRFPGYVISLEPGTTPPAGPTHVVATSK
ncbi:MAG: anti-sigma factor [Pseudonocardiales bacterium]|nr:anti-sigma factor [Pseudonocardiales bacterium]